MTNARKAPVSRRDRPAKPPLSREGVIAVSLRIMRDEGLEKVTMRRIAAELDTGPASLYVYDQIWAGHEERAYGVILVLTAIAVVAMWSANRLSGGGRGG